MFIEDQEVSNAGNQVCTNRCGSLDHSRCCRVRLVELDWHHSAASGCICFGQPLGFGTDSAANSWGIAGFR